MAPYLTDYHQRSSALYAKVLKTEEQRLQLEEKLRLMSSIDSRLQQRMQTDHNEAFWTRLKDESRQAEQRNSKLLADLDRAEENLNKLRADSERVIRLKVEYVNYLEKSYPEWEKPTISSLVRTEVDTAYDFNRPRLKSSEDNQRPTGKSFFEPWLVHRRTVLWISGFSALHMNEVDSPFVFPSHGVPSGRSAEPVDDYSTSEQTSAGLSRSKRSGSLRVDLTQSGLFFLLDYIEQELVHAIDKRKFYNHDSPTITQKQEISNIANKQQHVSLKDLDPAATTTFILEQLPSIIRRTTAQQCLFTEQILSASIRDLDKNAVGRMLPEQDRKLWLKLIDHLNKLFKDHIMTSETLANKFAPALIPNQALYIQDKAKSLLKHLIEQSVAPQISSSDDETSTDPKKQTVNPLVNTNSPPSSFRWDKLTARNGIDEDTSSSSSSVTTRRNVKSPSSTGNTPRANPQFGHDSDLEFYS